MVRRIILFVLKLLLIQLATQDVDIKIIFNAIKLRQ